MFDSCRTLAETPTQRANENKPKLTWSWTQIINLQNDPIIYPVLGEILHFCDLTHFNPSLLQCVHFAQAHCLYHCSLQDCFLPYLHATVHDLTQMCVRESGLGLLTALSAVHLFHGLCLLLYVHVLLNRLIANYITFAVGEVLLLILTICSLAAIFPRVSFNTFSYFYKWVFSHVFTIFTHN